MALDTVDKVLECFPHQTLTKLSGPPDYDQINTVNEELCENAAAIPSSVGNGTSGHMYLVLKPATMASIDPTPRSPPVDPTPGDRTGMTAAQLAAANRRYDKEKAVFRQAVAVHSALRK